MQKFFFQAVTVDGKQISGTMEGTDEVAVREKLANAKMAVLDVVVFDPVVHQNANQMVFDFVGTNLEGKPVTGTIESENLYEAYKKLRLEYNLDLSSLVDSTLSEAEKDSARALGISLEMEEQLKNENKHIKRELSNKDRLRNENQALITNALKSKEEESKIIQEEITNLITEVNSLLQKNKAFIDPVKRREIESQLDLLSRIKYSNAVDHLKNLSEKLFKTLLADDLFLEKSEIHESEQANYDLAISDVHGYAKEVKQNINRKFREIQLQIAGLSPDEIKKKLGSWGIGKIIRTTIYFSFVFFLILALIIFVAGFIASLLGWGMIYEVLMPSYLFWYFVGLSFLIVLFFGIDLEIEWKSSLHEVLFKILVFGLIFILYSLNSQVLFLWTL